jgi:uncharacterized protein YggT (Ycf19 family)
MIQVYFFSILILFVGGLSLLFRNIEINKKLLHPLKRILVNRGVQIGLGIASLVAGFLEFFIFTKADGILILENLFPALTGLILGGSLLLSVFTKKDKEQEGEIIKQDTGKIRSVVKKYHIPIGITSMSVAVLHLIFPAVIFL